MYSIYVYYWLRNCYTYLNDVSWEYSPAFVFRSFKKEVIFFKKLARRFLHLPIH